MMTEPSGTSELTGGGRRVTTAVPCTEVGTPIEAVTSALTSPLRTTVDARTRRSTLAVIHEARGSAAFAAAWLGLCTRALTHHVLPASATSATRPAIHGHRCGRSRPVGAAFAFVADRSAASPSRG